MTRQSAWIDVYPFNGRDLHLKNSRARYALSRELSDYCEQSWMPKSQKGWKNS
ncbi:MAG TPA: hypothetical protein VMC07_02700 [Candidatus Omnitrophota bacterium]|nr:hypothetical protein [Candidatus Omnitrophota bacterium]